MKASILRALIPFFVLWLGLVSASAQTPVNWLDTMIGSQGNWSTATDWSGGVVPNNGGGQTYSVTLPSVTGVCGPGCYDDQYGVALDMSPTISDLTVGLGACFSETPCFGGLSLLGRGAEAVAGASSQTLTTGSLKNSGSIGFDSTSVNVGGNFLNSGYFSGPDANVAGNVNNAPGGQLFWEGVMDVTGNIKNSSTIFDEGVITAARYIQTGSSSSMDMDYGGTMNVTDATVSGGVFEMAEHNPTQRDTLNGNLTMEGGTFEIAFLNGAAVNGNFTTTAASTYDEGMFEQGMCGGFWGQLAVSGDATLGGTLDLDFDNPLCPGVYQMMTYAAETGEFSTVNVLGAPYSKVTLDYGPTSLDVVIVGGPTPEPSSLLLMCTGLLVLAYCFRRITAERRVRTANAPSPPDR